MKIILAPDSFKGTFTASQVSDSFAAGVKTVLPEAELVKLPLADGGEGTLETLIAAKGGAIHRCNTIDPLGREIEVEYAILPGGEALVEMARSSGLVLLAESERNPWVVGTYGLGMVIRAVLAEKIRALTITLGGSATVDGGVGMARALGYRFLGSRGELIDREGGQVLAEISLIDKAHVDSRLATLTVRALCDVRNVLLGPSGAARVFAPQKGADPAMVDRLEQGMANLAQRIAQDLSVKVDNIPGAGAAGGLGAAVAGFLDGRLVPGIDYVLETLDFDMALAGADLVITGEGSFDSQSLAGKVISGVLQKASERSVPVAVVCGRRGQVPQSVRVFSGEDLPGKRAIGSLLSLDDLSFLAAEVVRSFALE